MLSTMLQLQVLRWWWQPKRLPSTIKKHIDWQWNYHIIVVFIKLLLNYFGIYKTNIKLFCFQAYNAKQLSDWCLHFISTNFSVFESTEEFDLLQGENRKHVIEHRWPPLSYLKALEEFEQRAPQSNLTSKCKVMWNVCLKIQGIHWKMFHCRSEY